MSTEFSVQSAAFLAAFTASLDGSQTGKARKTLSCLRALESLPSGLSGGWAPVLGTARGYAVQHGLARVARAIDSVAATVLPANAVLDGDTVYSCSGAGKAGRACEGYGFGYQFGPRIMSRSVRVDDEATLARYRSTCEVVAITPHHTDESKLVVDIRTKQNACMSCRSLASRYARKMKASQ